MCAEHRFVVTRAELHAQVWATPMSRLAARYGISDVALAKWCRKLNVPRPPRGYWAKRAAGHRVSQAKLPKADEEAAGAALVVTDPSSLPPRPATPPAEETEQVPDIAVPIPPADPHPALARTRKAMEAAVRRAPLGSGGLLRPVVSAGSGCIDVSVSAQQVDRALAVLDAACRELERRGFSLATEASSATCGSETLTFRVSEASEQVPYQPTAGEREEVRRHPYGHEIPSSTTKCLGRLILQCRIAGDYPWRTAREGPHCTLEHIVGKFVHSMIELAARSKAHREEIEANRRRWEEERQREAAEAERRRRAQERYDELIAETKEWRLASDLRSYAAYVRSAAETRGVTISEASELAKWLAWVERLAERHDPASRRLSLGS